MRVEPKINSQMKNGGLRRKRSLMNNSNWIITCIYAYLGCIPKLSLNVTGGEKSSKEGTFSTANSTFILPSTAADDKPIPPATETRKPSPEIPAPSFSAFDAAKSIFSKVTHPFTAFHKEKPVTKVPPVVTPALVDTPESSNPFSTFHIEKPANMNPPSIIPSKSHTETLKSANPFSGSNSSVRSPKPADVLSSSHSEKLNGNTQANNAVGSSKSSSEVTKPFSTFQQDKLKNTSDGNTTTIISAGKTFSEFQESTLNCRKGLVWNLLVILICDNYLIYIFSC